MIRLPVDFFGAAFRHSGAPKANPESTTGLDAMFEPRITGGSRVPLRGPGMTGVGLN